MAKDFNATVVVEYYDDHIRKLIPAYELVHQQIQVLLSQYMPSNAHILIVGCGTGQELIQLAQAMPSWQFTAIDPAQNMIEKTAQRIQDLKLQNKIQLIHADTSVLKNLNLKFDAALSILVAHFIENKTAFYQEINEVLNKNAILISYDLTRLDKVHHAYRLQALAELTGLHAKQSGSMLAHLDEDFDLVSAQQLQDLYQSIGFKHTEIFCQIFNYCAIIAYKSSDQPINRFIMHS